MSLVHRGPGRKARKYRKEKMVSVHPPKKQGYVGREMEREVAKWARKEGADGRERAGVLWLVVRVRSSLQAEGWDVVERQRRERRQVGGHLRQCFCVQ